MEFKISTENLNIDNTKFTILIVQNYCVGICYIKAIDQLIEKMIKQNAEVLTESYNHQLKLIKEVLINPMSDSLSNFNDEILELRNDAENLYKDISNNIVAITLGMGGLKFDKVVDIKSDANFIIITSNKTALNYLTLSDLETINKIIQTMVVVSDDEELFDFDDYKSVNIFDEVKLSVEINEQFKSLEKNISENIKNLHKNHNNIQRKIDDVVYKCSNVAKKYQQSYNSRLVEIEDKLAPIYEMQESLKNSDKLNTKANEIIKKLTLVVMGIQHDLDTLYLDFDRIEANLNAENITKEDKAKENKLYTSVIDNIQDLDSTKYVIEFKLNALKLKYLQIGDYNNKLRQKLEKFVTIIKSMLAPASDTMLLESYENKSNEFYYIFKNLFKLLKKDKLDKKQLNIIKAVDLGFNTLCLAIDNVKSLQSGVAITEGLYLIPFVLNSKNSIQSVDLGLNDVIAEATLSFINQKKQQKMVVDDKMQDGIAEAIRNIGDCIDKISVLDNNLGIDKCVDCCIILKTMFAQVSGILMGLNELNADRIKILKDLSPLY